MSGRPHGGASIAVSGGGSRWWALADVGLVVALMAADFYGVVPYTSTPFLLALGWVSLRLRGLGWPHVGLSRPPNGYHALVVGVVAGLAMELFATYVTVPVLSHLAGRPPDLSDFRPLVGDVRLLLVAVLANWVLAAFGEELGYRGYVMNRIADLGGGTRASWALSLVATSALFGWGHGGQGVTGMVQEGLAACVLGLLYLASRRNLVVPIVAHGVSNTLAFVLIFFDRYPGV